ncbi:hypothetical protein B0H14DRAFT_2632164 [Mycena olivaceomarginata]|nr:hypothetical protein B0H14DRAFT_2632164 [Mycena olivaceomarginata]
MARPFKTDFQADAPAEDGEDDDGQEDQDRRCRAGMKRRTGRTRRASKENGTGREMGTRRREEMGRKKRGKGKAKKVVVILAVVSNLTVPSSPTLWISRRSNATTSWRTWCSGDRDCREEWTEAVRTHITDSMSETISDRVGGDHQNAGFGLGGKTAGKRTGAPLNAAGPYTKSSQAIAANGKRNCSGRLADYIIETMSVAAWGIDWAAMEGKGSNKLQNGYHADTFFKLHKYAAHFQNMSHERRF